MQCWSPSKLRNKEKSHREEVGISGENNTDLRRDPGLPTPRRHVGTYLGKDKDLVTLGTSQVIFSRRAYFGGLWGGGEASMPETKHTVGGFHAIHVHCPVG